MKDFILRQREAAKQVIRSHLHLNQITQDAKEKPGWRMWGDQLGGYCSR